ncbi:hypothetical protein CDL15_Pgr023955 [Punica granatum]|uniref:Uncharacterized protein n=1 Tax=Punica granatum TaxID=22663 RepID=A0A218WWK6_PUNGR|nr:hypothetical protein CDL15_Pgr023955 [Punica granatum]
MCPRVQPRVQQRARASSRAHSSAPALSQHASCAPRAHEHATRARQLRALRTPPAHVPRALARLAPRTSRAPSPESPHSGPYTRDAWKGGNWRERLELPLRVDKRALGSPKACDDG